MHRESPPLILVPFLSPRTRQRLEMAGFSYVDLTGNVRFTMARPAIFIDARGADENPEPAKRERRSLKGAKAGRLIRALCDFRPPFGLRELAKRANVDAGYTSRVVQTLVRDALVVRTARGPITSVDWSALLRRWAEDYSPLKQSRVSWYLAPRGLAPVVDTLKTLRGGYVVSAAWAANHLRARRTSAIAAVLRGRCAEAGEGAGPAAGRHGYERGPRSTIR